MKLRLGQPVHTLDGLFGVLGNIVIDPEDHTVTNLVVDPHRHHFQARLVPIWMVEVDNDTVAIGVDEEHLRQLQRVHFTDYVRYGRAIDLGDEWDVGTADVVYMPDMDPDFDMEAIDHQVKVVYDRIPKGDCEIRRKSTVVSVDQRQLGSVQGFITNDDHLRAAIVRTPQRFNVAVPFHSVARVLNDRIELSIDEASFHMLPRTMVEASEDPQSVVERVQERVESLAADVFTRGRSVIENAKKFSRKAG